MPLYSIGERRVTLVGKDHFVAPDATLVGDITLEAAVSIWFQVVIRAENDRILIGEGSNVQDGAVLDVAAFADRDAVVLGADHDLEPDAHFIMERDVADQRCIVRDEMVVSDELHAALANGVEGHAAIIAQ